MTKNFYLVGADRSVKVRRNVPRHAAGVQWDEEFTEPQAKSMRGLGVEVPDAASRPMAEPISIAKAKNAKRPAVAAAILEDAALAPVSDEKVQLFDQHILQRKKGEPIRMSNVMIQAWLWSFRDGEHPVPEQ